MKSFLCFALSIFNQEAEAARLQAIQDEQDALALAENQKKIDYANNRFENLRTKPTFREFMSSTTGWAKGIMQVG